MEDDFLILFPEELHLLSEFLPQLSVLIQSIEDWFGELEFTAENLLTVLIDPGSKSHVVAFVLES